jgi:hypothetical protein
MPKDLERTRNEHQEVDDDLICSVSIFPSRVLR